jgi:hypothetical protein
MSKGIGNLLRYIQIGEAADGDRASLRIGRRGDPSDARARCFPLLGNNPHQGRAPLRVVVQFVLDVWCREWKSNPHDPKGQGILIPLRLPVAPPLARCDTTLQIGLN